VLVVGAETTLSVFGPILPSFSLLEISFVLLSLLILYIHTIIILILSVHFTYRPTFILKFLIFLILKFSP